MKRNEEHEVKMWVNDAYYPLLENTHRYIGMYGGAGSGKSMFAAQKILLRLTSEPGHRFLFVRKVASTLRGSMYQLFKDLTIDYNCYNEFSVNKTEMRFTHLSTGNEIFCVGVDDPEKLKSIQGITGIWIEEATELTRDDFTQLDLRLRGQTYQYKQILLTWNPVDENHWLKTEFCTPEGVELEEIVPDMQWQYLTEKEIDDELVSANTTILRTTYNDNQFIDSQYKAVLTEKVKSNKNYYRIYVLGKWGKLDVGHQFYNQFDHDEHIGAVEYLPHLPVLLTFDFNVKPYMTMLCCQQQLVGDTIQLRVFDEYCLRDPHNRTSECCKRFLQDYGDQCNTIFYYGDAQGNRQIEGYGDKRRYDEVRKYLYPLMNSRSNRTLRRNPAVFKCRDFVNDMLAGYYPVRVIIDENKCPELMRDMENTKVDTMGILKEIVRDATGGSFEKYGHTSDALRYLLWKEYKHFE